jgi:threonine/homoserine/homoserine lactone efflux protein
MVLCFISWMFIVPAFTLGFAAAVQPGPLSLYLISQTLKAGWKRTFPAIFTPLITDGPVAVFCLVILSHLPPHFLKYMQILGGGYILYLAYRAIMEWREKHTVEISSSGSSRVTLLNAIAINILNPNAYLGWSLVIGPLFLKGWKEYPAVGIGFLAFFYLTMIITTLVMLRLIHKAGERGPRLQRALSGFAGLFLAGYGIYYIFAGVGALIGN